MKVIKLTCLLLCLCVLTSFLPVSAFNAGDGVFASRLSFSLEDETVLRAIIVFEGDAGIDLQNRGKADSITDAGKTVKLRQRSLVEEITNEHGAALVYRYSVLLNGIAVDARYGALKEIEKIKGVKGVYLANSFESPKAEVALATTVGGAGSLGTDLISGNGAGSIVAVLDTSFYLKHEAFQQTANVKETLTAQDVQNLKESPLGLNGKGEYISKKVPYAYDYADKDMNVANGAYHGTGVASIAVGDNGSNFHGAARNAQLLAMKVFSDASGNTDSSVYFHALEDAYTLGADVVNMSFGAQNGFTYDPELENVVFGNVYDKMKKAGVFVICAAGNEYSEGYSEYAYNRYSVKNGVDGVTADYADYGVVGTPSTYGDNISVAAAENVKHYAYGIKVGNTAVEYFDKAESLYEHFYSNFAGRSLEYVIVPGNGASSDYSGINVRGRIAVVKRGGISDTEKLTVAAQNGALGLICYNTTNDAFYLSYKDYVIPSAAITKASFDVLNSASVKTLTVSMGVVPVENHMAGTMCDFSSWGVTPDLKLKPNITGVGGGVLCAGITSTGDYSLMSGTSMAAPTVSGFFAAALAALPFDAGLTRAERYSLAYSLVFSTAVPLEYAKDLPYSPRKQGVGMPVHTGLSATVAFESPIVHLGDDDGKTGKYTFSADLVDLFGTGKDVNVSFDGAEVITDNFLYDSNLDCTYNTLTPHLLGAAVKVDKSSYKARDKVTVTVTLSEADKQYLAAAENGAFVEGYVYFTYQNGTDTQRIKLTFLGFYGDWGKAPTFEKYDWGEVIDQMVWMLDTVDPATGKTYADLGYTVYDFMDMNVGFNEAYFTDVKGEDIAFFGDNLYSNVPFDADRLSLSTGAATGKNMAQKFTYYPSLLRNVEHIIMTVSNADTGVVYYVDDTAYGIKNFFNTKTGEFEEGTYFQWDGTYLDSLGRTKYLPNNTRIKVTFETQLASEGEEKVLQREYYMYIDYEAPKINYSWNKNTKMLTVSAKDNRYISNIFVIMGDYDVYAVSEPVVSSKPDRTYTVTFDLSDVDFGNYKEFTLEVQDYATNYANLTVSLDSDSTNIELLVGDVNLDGSIDNLDAVTVLRYDAGSVPLSDEQKKAGDTNGDGMVDNLDATLILKYDAGLINGF